MLTMLSTLVSLSQSLYQTIRMWWGRLGLCMPEQIRYCASFINVRMMLNSPYFNLTVLICIAHICGPNILCVHTSRKRWHITTCSERYSDTENMTAPVNVRYKRNSWFWCYDQKTYKCISRLSESRDEIILCQCKGWSHVVKIDNFTISEMTDHNVL